MKIEFVQCRALAVFAFASALSFSVTMQNVSAQTTDNCTPELSSGADLNKQIVRIGDTITVTAVSASTPALGCSVREISGYLVKPNLNTQTIFTGGSLDPSQCIRCPSIAVCVGTATCLGGVNLTYVVAAADIGKPISGTFTAPDGSLQTLSRSAVPFHVQFFPVALGRVPSVPPGNRSGEIPAGQGQATARVITPCVTITKECVTDCTLFGQPIQFSGTVCNTGNNNQPDASGNHDLVNIVITDIPAATITFASTTSLGNPFSAIGSNNRLRAGECVNYTGSYSPTGTGAALCGPFTDTISVVAVDVTGHTNSNTDECWTTPNGIDYVSSGPRPPVTATCFICNNPGIAINKQCPPGLVPPGGALSFTSVVTNTGNVPLTNVVVFNDQPAPNTLVFGPTNLAIGASLTFTNSYIVPPDSCGPYADTLRVEAKGICGGSVSNTASAVCPGTNNPSIDVVKACPPGLIQPGELLTVTGTVTNTGDITLTNVVVTNTIAALGNLSRRVLGPITLAPGDGTNFSDSYIIPLDSCGPYADTFAASGADKCFGRVVLDSAAVACAYTNSPSMDVTKACPPGLIQPGQLLTVTGTVTNTGNITLTNVLVTNTIAALGNLSRRVLGPIILAPGAGTNFSDSYIIPLDSCGPYADTFAASGADKCFGRVVLDSASVACAYTNNPSIDVTKACPPGLIQPGQFLTVTGTVTNTGNITLTNVMVTNTITALGNLARRVLGPISLAPGAGTNFSDSYVIPLDSCGPYADTFAGSGADKCFGRVVLDSASVACAYTNSPRINITKYCPPAPVAPGQITTISGVVSNAGNITLTNVIVFDDQPTNNTPLLGPIILAPGQTATFINSYRIPPNCCTYVDTVTTSGRDKCFGRLVTASATAACPTATDPRISVTKTCPPLPVPLGERMIFSGTVSNAGNITLTNVTVVNNQPSNNTPVFGPITLAPGETANYSGSYVVPIDICDTNILDTVIARGHNLCNGAIVSAGQSALCPIVPTPRLVVTKNCPPNPVPPGGLLMFSGIVSNAGNITLTNVIVVNDHPTNNTPVLGPVTLAPKQSINFSGSYRVCPECCPPFVDTLVASGAQSCNGSNVTATATAYCPGITTPNLSLTVGCPFEPIFLGELYYSGTVSNAGDVTLGEIVVTDNKAGVVAEIFALAPGETEDFYSFFTPTNCGPNVFTLVTASAFDVCTGNYITNTTGISCTIPCPTNSQPPILLGPAIVNGQFTFSFDALPGRSYAVQYTPSLLPENWQTLTNFMGNGSTVIVSDSRTNNARFYRVLVE